MLPSFSDLNKPYDNSLTCKIIFSLSKSVMTAFAIILTGVLFGDFELSLPGKNCRFAGVLHNQCFGSSMIFNSVVFVSGWNWL